MDSFPRPRLFYIFGCLYGALFLAISLLLAHPEAGLFNTTTSSYRLLGWLSYVSIESFGSLMVQSFWAVASSSVDISFARRNFGYVVAAAQVGSILGPMLATQAEIIGIPSLYLLGAGLCFVTVWLMRTYIRRYCPTTTATTTEHEPHSIEGKKSAGVMEGVHLLMEHDYVKGIFAVSSLYMIQVAVFDFTMKVLAQQHYTALYPNDPFRAIRAFASFMGKFGMVTNSVSLLFSMFGTGAVLHHCGLTATLTVFPAVMLASTHLVWALPTLPVLFGVMILIKATNFAVLNPTKEMLYQVNVCYCGV
jgi:AAA family ATP:ADP antiporter